MKLIPLTKGMSAMVDDSDHEWLSQYKWYAHKRGDLYYAARNETIGCKKRRTVSMHRLILDAGDMDEVDHANRDTLDNRRKNIRICTRSDNMVNKEFARTGPRKYRGTHLSRSGRRWEARITKDGRSRSLGYFSTEEEAAMAYDKKARRLHGKFARLNFSDVPA